MRTREKDHFQKVFVHFPPHNKYRCNKIQDSSDWYVSLLSSPPYLQACLNQSKYIGCFIIVCTIKSCFLESNFGFSKMLSFRVFFVIFFQIVRKTSFLRFYPCTMLRSSLAWGQFTPLFIIPMKTLASNNSN